MVDRIARKQAAETIRHFVSGQITNDDFIERYPHSRNDPVIWALYDTIWCLYDDIAIHKLTGKDALPKEIKKRIARWLLFLYSDKEYEWPRISSPGFCDFPTDSWLGKVMRILFSYGVIEAGFMACGDYDVWPFLSREDFEDARRKPVLLTGHI
jgi:hypothetical protein